jgi:fibronectin-binding autotransporter adhesin
MKPITVDSHFSVQRITPAFILAMVVFLGLEISAIAQPVVAYTADPVNTPYGGASAANGDNLNIGHTFFVNGAGIEVFQLGFFDYQDEPLAGPHTVTLFNNQTPLASVTIPEGTNASVLDCYAFEPLATPIYLPAGFYTVLAYGVNGNDPYGEADSVGFNGSPNLSIGDGVYDFTAAGSPAYWNTDAGGYEFASASFTYTNVSAGAQATWTGGGANNNWSTAGNWDVAPVSPAPLLFAGNTRLTNNNDLASFTALGITFDSAAGAFVLGGNAITLGGSISFNGNPATPVTQTVNLNMYWSASQTIDTPANGNLTLGGAITSSADTSLIKTDAGTLTLGGTDNIVSWDLNGGTTTITGNTTINGDGGRIYVGDGDAINNCNGTLVIQPGAALSIIGNYGDAFVIGRDSGSGTVIQNGGTFSFNPANQTYMFVGASDNTATTSEYDMNGGVLDMNGKTLGVALAVNVLIDGTVNQTGGVITNVGQLWLDSAFTTGFSTYNLTGGSLYVEAGGLIVQNGGAYQMNLGGGTIGAEANWSSSLNLTLTGSNGPVTFNPAGNIITLSGALSGGGGLTVSGGGTLDLQGINTYTGDTVVNTGSVLQLDQTGSSAGAIRLANGASLDLTFSSGVFAAGKVYTNGVALAEGTYTSANLNGFITGSGSLEVVSGISTGRWTGLGGNNNWSTAGNWDNNAVPIFPHPLTFAGSTGLINNNDLSGITVSTLTFDAAAGAFTLNGNAITLNDDVVYNGNPAAPVTQTVNLSLTLSANQIVDTPTNGNLSLGGDITSLADLNKLDAGTLTLGGTNTIESLDVNGGTNTITGNTTLNGNDSSGNYDRFYVGDGDSYHGCNGTLVIQPGAVLSVTGSFNDAAVIGRDGGSGTVIQNGGTFTFNPGNNNYMFIGATSDVGTEAAYDMNGGVLDMSYSSLGVGLGDNHVVYTAYLNQTGGSIINLNELDLGAVRSYGIGNYTLTGGSITVDIGGIISDDGTYVVNLGGGTVGASDSWSSSLNMTLTGVNGPVTFDPAGNTIYLSGILSGSGGLIATNGGALELAGANYYSGDTIVAGGTILQLDTNSSSAGAFRLAANSVLFLNNSGTTVVGHLYTNGVSLANGIYNSGNLNTYIAGGGSIQVVGGVSTGLWTGLGANNNWSTAGNWNNNAVPLSPIGLTFAGSLHLANNNDLAGFTADSITFDSAAGAFVLNGDAISLNGNIGFTANPAAPVTQTIDLGMTWNGSITVNTPANGNLSLDGGITSTTDTSLVKVDAGALTLGGANNIVSWDLNGGTTTITGTTTINGDGGRIYVGDGDALLNCNGSLVIQPGANLSVTGNYGDAFVIGRDTGSGTVTQNGGTFTFSPGNQSLFIVGATSFAGTTASYDMNGGLLDLTGDILAVALGNGASTTDVVNQVSGVITNVGNLRLGALTPNGYGIYNLTGGTIYIGSGGISTDDGLYAFNLGGGTVAAEASWSSSLKMTLTGSGGPVTFNPAGNTITLSGVLSGVGGLTVAGGGTLELSGANAYTGTTLVNSGVLQLDSTANQSGTIKLATGTTLKLNFAGTCVVSNFYNNNVALASGTYTAANLSTYITGTGSLHVLGSIPNTPTSIEVTVGVGSLNFSWPNNYLGWILQMQTNLSAPQSSWIDVPGTAGVTSTNITINPSAPAVYYRLRYP